MLKDTFKPITAERAKEIRTTTGLSQKAFWATLGCAQATGSHYEAAVTYIPRPVQLLMHSMYVDETTASAGKLKRAAVKAAKILDEAIK